MYKTECEEVGDAVHVEAKHSRCRAGSAFRILQTFETILEMRRGGSVSRAHGHYQRDDIPPEIHGMICAVPYSNDVFGVVERIDELTAF